MKEVAGQNASIFRQLSRHLVGLWTAENPVAMNLLKRILVGSRMSLLSDFHTYIRCLLKDGDVTCLVTKCKARKRPPILMCFVPF